MAVEIKKDASPATSTDDVADHRLVNSISPRNPSLRNTKRVEASDFLNVGRVKFRRPLVSTLNGRCRPPTIARLVVAIHVDAVDRVFRRGSRAHIRKERHERGVPRLANANPAASVMLPLCGVGVLAAISKIVPTDVLRRPATNASTVFERSASSVILEVQTSARTGVAPGQRVRVDRDSPAALTRAVPVVASRCSLNGDQPAEGLAGNVDSGTVDHHRLSSRWWSGLGALARCRGRFNLAPLPQSSKVEV